MDYLISAHGLIDLDKSTFCPKEGQTIVLFSEPGKAMTTSLENNILFEKDILEDPCIKDIDNCQKYSKYSKIEKDKIFQKMRDQKMRKDRNPKIDDCFLFPLDLLSRGHKVYEKCRNLKCKFCQKFLNHFNENNLPVSIWDHERCQTSRRGGMPDISLSFGPLVDKNSNLWKYGIYPLPNNEYHHSKRTQSKYHIGLYKKDASVGEDITYPILKTCWEGSIPFEEEFIKILDKQGSYNLPFLETDKDLEEYADIESRGESYLEVLRLVSNQKIINGIDKEYTEQKIAKHPQIYLSEIMEYLPSGTYFISACRSWIGKKYDITPRYKDIFYFDTYFNNSKYYPFRSKDIDIILYPSKEKYQVIHFFPDTMEFMVLDKKKNNIFLNVKEINYRILNNFSTQSRYYIDKEENLVKLNHSPKEYNFTKDDLLIYPFIKREPYNLIKIQSKNYSDNDLEIGRRFDFSRWDGEKEGSIILGKKDNNIIYNKFIRDFLDTINVEYILNPIKCQLLNIKEPLRHIYIRNYGYFGRLLKTTPYEYNSNFSNKTELGSQVIRKNIKYLVGSVPKYYEDNRLFLDINYQPHYFKDNDSEIKRIPQQYYKLFNHNEDSHPHFIKNHLVGPDNLEKRKGIIYGKSSIFDFITGITGINYEGRHLLKKYGIYGDLFIKLLEKLTDNFIFLDEKLNETNLAKISDILGKIENEMIILGYSKDKYINNIFSDFLELIILGNFTTVKYTSSDLIEYEWSQPYQNNLDKMPFFYQDEIITQTFREGSVLAIYWNYAKDNINIRNQLLETKIIIRNNPVIYVLMVDPQLNNVGSKKIYEMFFGDIISSLGYNFSKSNKYRRIIENNLFDKYGKIDKRTGEPELLYVARLANDPDFMNDLIKTNKNGEIDEEDFAKILKFFQNLKYKWTAVQFRDEKKDLIYIEFISKEVINSYNSIFPLPKNFNKETRLSYLDFNNTKTNSIYHLDNLEKGSLNRLEQMVNKYWKFYLYKNTSFPNPIFFKLMEENGLIGEIIHNNGKTYLKLPLIKDDDFIDVEYLDITEFEKEMFLSYREINETSFFTRFPYNLKIGDIIYCLPQEAPSNNSDYMRYNKYRIVGYHFGNFLSYYYRVKDILTDKEFSIDLTKNIFFYEDEITETEQLKKLVLSRQESDLDRKTRF